MANTENQNFDYEQLEAKDIERLREQLRSFSTGVQGSLHAVQSGGKLKDAVATHSSHSDSDGWF